MFFNRRPGILKRLSIRFIIIGILFPIQALCAQHTPRTRFVILADRAGGECPGVFPRILEQAATLRPDFVIAIGDLIDGYTEDDGYLDAMWREFDDYISIFDVPFFAVPGNHDISNGRMAEKWKSRFGYFYTARIINDDLFLFMDTEDHAPGNITSEQVDYFKKSIDGYDGNGWIYVFMHRPLWKYSGNEQYDRFKRLLEGREKVIVFSGHEHHYLKRTAGGRDYYILATSGGGNELRSNSLGEFHHFFYVTCEKGGPVVSNILCDGIVSEDIVNQDNEDIVNTLRDDSWIRVNPVFLTDSRQMEVPFSFSVTPETDIPLKLDYALRYPEENLFPEVTGTVRVEGPRTVSGVIENIRHADLSVCRVPVIHFQLEADSGEGRTIVTEFDKKIYWDVQRRCGEEWIDAGCPYYVKEDWDWHGMEDCHYSFRLNHENESLVLDVKIVDEKEVRDADPAELQDKLFVRLGDGRAFYEFNIVNGRAYDEAYKSLDDIDVTSENNVIRVIIPLGNHPLASPFRFNIGMMDHDNVLNRKPSVLWWRAPWEPSSGEAGRFGSFVF